MRTLSKKLNTTSPMANDDCDKMPNKVSEAMPVYLSSCNNMSANTEQENISARVKLRSSNMPKVMPNNAPWAKVSPKKANRRQTTKLPNGPAVAATPKPANKGNNHQLIMFVFSTFFYMRAFVAAFNMAIGTMCVVVVVGVVS